jgi:hypothetical protein
MLDGPYSTADVKQGQLIDASLVDGVDQHAGGLAWAFGAITRELSGHIFLAE